jgi:hypothetical protein
MTVNYKNLGKHMIISGVTVGLFAYLAENMDQKIIGFLYGSIPVGFLYIMFMANMSKNEKINFTHASLIGGLFFVLYMSTLYLLFKNTSFNILTNIILTTIVFLLIILLVNKYLYNFIKLK